MSALWIATILAGTCAGADAQAVDAKVCDIVNHPKDFDGKIVRVTGLVQADFDSFVMRGDSCSSVLWLSYPAGTKARSGPAALVTMQLSSNATGTLAATRPAVTLERSKDFDTFDNLLSQRPKTPGMCLGCPKSDVKATLTGRIDGTENPGVARDKSGVVTGLDGFGNLNQYDARLVIETVANVTAQEIDYSKVPKVEGDNPGGNTRDYQSLIPKAETAFPKGSPAIAEIDKAMAVLPAAGQDNGVMIAMGDVANVPDGEGAKGAKASADGLLFTIRMDPDKIKGDAGARALIHEASLVEQLRETQSVSAQVLEIQAWQLVLDVVIGSRQKTLTLPGAVLLWNEAWPAADRNSNATAGLRGYVVDREETPR